MKRKTFRKILIGLVSLFLLVLGGVILFYFLVKAGVFGPLPGKEELTDIKNATATVVLSSDAEQIGRIFAENRTNAEFEELPQNLIDALIATEDARFYEHEGIDRRSVLRVVFKTLLLGDESAGGGSTITQQLAKNMFGRKPFGFLSIPVNKTKEMILAQRLEELYSKDDIIELYLNTVSFSENVYGVETASQRFFNKKPGDLKPHESAVLVGILKANTYYNPRLHPENARGRRNVVLHQMYRYGYITEAKKDSLQELPLQLDYRKIDEHAIAPYFMVHVKKRAAELLQQVNVGEEPPDMEMDGLRIHTTLNADMQRYAREAVQEHMARLQGLFDRHWQGRSPWAEHPKLFERSLKASRSYQKLQERGVPEDSLYYYLEKEHPVQVYHPEGDSVMEMSVKDSVAYYLRLLNSSFLAMDPQDGALLAWVGGLDFQFLPYDHVTSKRQAASTFKPFVYATALRQGVDPCDYLPNERRVYEEHDDWAPRNYNNEYGGYYSMAGALKKSINVAAVQTIFETGVEDVLATAHSFGIDSHFPNDPSIALGSGSVSLLEMIRGYAVFANGGYRVDPYMITKIEAADGTVLYQSQRSVRKKVLEEEVSELMTAMLQGAVNEGTGIKLRTVYGLRNELAGKTGTAQDYTDGWFIGYNPEIVAGAWVGASSPAVHFRTGTYGSGSAMALPVFGKFFQKLNRNPALSEYSRARFDELSPELQEELACEDFREKNVFDSLRGIFDKKEGKKISEPEPEEEEKPGFFKRLFGGKKKK